MPYSLRVLLVDDDPAFALLVRSALEMSCDPETPYSLTCLKDGPYAVDYILGRGEYADRSKFPLPDIVLLDQRMNHMDGTDVLRELKSHNLGKNIPFCIMSTSDQRKQQELSYELGATLYITKPLELEQLGRKLKLLIEFSTHVLELPRNRG